MDALLAQQQFLQKLAALAVGGALPMPGPQVSLPISELLPSLQQIPPGDQAFTNLILQFHAFWKSKVCEVHSGWKEVTENIDIKKLEKRNLSADKRFADREMPKFKLGNRVRIVSKDKRLFKILHKKVGVWKESLFEVVGKEAIVMNLSSQYVIGVASVDNGVISLIHGFALELIDNGEEEGLWQNRTDFKRDDDVVIGVDDAVLANLQVNARKTPYINAARLRGYIARVMCVFSGEVAVTFDEMNHELFHPAALELYRGKESGTQRRLASKSANETVLVKGTKVTVIDDLQKILTLQRGHGEWYYKMTKYVGEDGRVVDNMPGGDVIVRFNPFESYRMNRQAVIKRTGKNSGRNRKKAHPSGQRVSVPFQVGDIVRLNLLPQDLLSNLQLLRIPNAFMPIIGGCMKFIGYKDLRNGVVDFGDGIQFYVDLRLFTRVGQAMSKEHKAIFKKDEEIEVGKEGMLWAGPKHFAKSVLKEMRGGFEKALSETGTILGYEQNGNAVLRYSDGKIYTIPDEYVCSKRALWLQETEEQSAFIDWSKESTNLPRTVSHVEAAILHSITEVLRANNEKDALEWNTTIQSGDPPESKVILLSIPGQLNDRDKFEEQLKAKLFVERLDCRLTEGRIIITAPGESYEVKIESDAGEGIAPKSPKKVESPKLSGKGELTRSSSVQESWSETPQPLGSALPTASGPNAYNVAIPAGVQHVTLILNGQSGSQVPAFPNSLQRMPDVSAAARTSQGPSIINMFGDGGSTFNINSSNVRFVDAGQNDEEE